MDNIWAAGGVVTRAARVGAGDEVLDVACGTGNAAIQAAQVGGRVTGVDLTPELFAAARRRAAAAGVEIDLVEGDAEHLPFEDGSFDVVLSTFGAMFAPRHAVTANEIVRVLRPGGRIGLANWEPDGSAWELFRTMARHLPPPPPTAEPPLLWGTEEHVRELFDERLELQFTRHRIPPNEGDPSELADRYIAVLPDDGDRPGVARAAGAVGGSRGRRPLGRGADVHRAAHLPGGDRHQALTRPHPAGTEPLTPPDYHYT